MGQMSNDNYVCIILLSHSIMHFGLCMVYLYEVFAESNVDSCQAQSRCIHMQLHGVSLTMKFMLHLPCMECGLEH